MTLMKSLPSRVGISIQHDDIISKNYPSQLTPKLKTLIIRHLLGARMRLI